MEKYRKLMIANVFLVIAMGMLAGFMLGFSLAFAALRDR